MITEIRVACTHATRRYDGIAGLMPTMFSYVLDLHHLTDLRRGYDGVRALVAAEPGLATRCQGAIPFPP